MNIEHQKTILSFRWEKLNNRLKLINIKFRIFLFEIGSFVNSKKIW